MWFRRSILYVYFFVICYVTCNNIKIPDRKETFPLHRHAKELVDMCFTNNSGSVMISADLLGNNWGSGGNSIIVIDKEFKKQMTGFNSAYPTYVLSSDSIVNLKGLIDNLHKSTLWSIKSPFLILETKSQCTNAGKVLEYMWMQDLLAVYYLCNVDDSTIVFTLNPFGSYAPAPWVQIDKFGDREKKLTLFSLKYSKDKNICKNVTFDKTVKLDGHRVKLAAFIDFSNIPPAKSVSKIKKYIDLMNNTDAITTSKILSHVNATPRTNFFDHSNQYRFLKYGYAQKLVDKTNDITDKSLQLADTNYKYMDIVTQYDEATFSILTKKSNYLTTISQVTCSYQFVVLTIFVLMLIAVIVIINNKFDVSGGILDIVSLTAGMGVMTPLDRLSMRIIYCSGFLFIFTVMPDLQGQVSAILSKPLRRNVETLKDLYENKYYVFFDGLLVNDMINEKLWVTDGDKQYLHPSNFILLDRCVTEAQFNSTIACIQFRSQQLYSASKSEDLHVSTEVIFKKYYVHWARKDWSIKDTVDRVSSWYSEAGFLDLVENVDIKYYLKQLKKKKRIQESGNVEYIEFDTLMVSYMIVFGFSLLGLVSFGFELLFHKYETRRRQILIRRRRQRSLRSQPRIIFFPGRMVLSNPCNPIRQ